MLSPFNIENDFLEQKQLKADFEVDPIAVCEKMRAVLEQCRISTRAIEEVEMSENIVQKALQTIDLSADTFIQSIRQRNSMFRGGEDSVRAYRALIPFLLALEGRRGAIRTQMRALLRWKDCLAALRPLIEGVLGGVASLQFFASKENTDVKIEKKLEDLWQDAKKELEAQKQLLKRIEKDLSAGEQLDRGVIGGFLGCIYEASDSEHDGENCHCTKVIELIAGLRERLKCGLFES